MEILLSVIGFILVSLLGIVAFFLKKTLRDLEVRMQVIEKESKEIKRKHQEDYDKLKTNYTNRFDQMNQKLERINELQHDIKDDIIREIHKISTEVAVVMEKVVNQMQYFDLVQNNKKIKNNQ